MKMLLPSMTRAALSATRMTRADLVEKAGVSRATLGRHLDGENVSESTHGKLIAAFRAQGITFHKGRGWWSIKVEVRG